MKKYFCSNKSSVVLKIFFGSLYTSKYYEEQMIYQFITIKYYREYIIMVYWSRCFVHLLIWNIMKNIQWLFCFINWLVFKFAREIFCFLRGRLFCLLKNAINQQCDYKQAVKGIVNICLIFEKILKIFALYICLVLLYNAMEYNKYCVFRRNCLNSRNVI